MNMIYPRDNELNETTETGRDPHLVLDGTVNLEYFDDEQVPRVKGLIELLEQYFTGGE
jgi:hypothetical protein